MTTDDPEVDPEGVTLGEPSGLDDGRQVPLPERDFDVRYQAGAVLGEGGTGHVALHLDAWMGRHVAVKVLRERLRSSERLRASFLREARIQGQLEHPSVVPVYDLGVDESGHPYFTMRRVQGKTLETLLEEAAAVGRDDHDPRKLLAAFARVCLAVQYAHERGVLHRDLKPSNIMLGEFGEVYVLDWGIARTTEEEGAAAPLGTPGYMAPEQIAREAVGLGPATDAYALGAILFEILTLENPHPGEGAGAVLRATAAGIADHVAESLAESDVPPELASLCTRALAFDPDDRPASARALHDVVEGYLTGERDLELRQRLAAEHAASAIELLEGSDDITRRQDAMREIGRALALDPTNGRAMHTMVRLLDSPPERIPDEVRQASERGHRDRLRAIGRFAAACYAAMFFLLPLVLLAGVRTSGPFLAFFGGCALASLITYLASRTGSQRLALGALVVSSAAAAASAWVYGPLIIMPQAVIINLLLYCFVLEPRYVGHVIAVGLLAVGVPLGLELAGVTHGYVMGEGGVTIVEQGLTIGRTTMLLVGLAAAVFGLVFGALAAAFYHQRLLTMERQLILRGWHLRQMVGAPDEA